MHEGHEGHRVKKNGKTKAGTQQYYCLDCQKSFTGTQHGGNRNMLGDRPMTPAEKQKRYRQNLKEKVDVTFKIFSV